MSHNIRDMQDHAPRTPLRAVNNALACLLLAFSLGGAEAHAQSRDIHIATGSRNPTSDKVIIDTDIGYDIDDAFAVALALDSPELEILGFSTVSGDTLARARILDRMLGESDHANIPVAVGDPTLPPSPSWPADIMDLQRRYGDSGRYVRTSHLGAVDFILEKLRQYPGQITLVAIGPLSNVGALIDRDIDSFRKVKRVVMMGGQVKTVDGIVGRATPPSPEYNIMLDIRSAQKLFRSGVPIYVIPIDSTYNLALDEVKRERVFSAATPLTDSLALLYLLWNNTTPILYDAMAVTFAVDQKLCPMEPMHLSVDDDGVMHAEPGATNAQVCLRSDPSAFFDYFMARTTGSPMPHGSHESLVSDRRSAQ